MDAIPFLNSIRKQPRHPIYVLSGDENFLRKACRDALISHLLQDADPEFALAVFPPESPDFTEIRKELETLSFMAPVRICVLEQADAFITKHRETLERYFAQPSKVGVLILEPQTFPDTTKLAKALPDHAKILCKALKDDKLPAWCQSWAKQKHDVLLNSDAAAMLVEMVEPSMGLLAQEIAKLAQSVVGRTEITPEDVERLVGRSRAANVFHILDAIGDNKPARALEILNNLMEEGEQPIAVLGALTFSLRRLANVGRLVSMGQTLGPAMDAAGIPKWPVMRQSAERQLKHLGRKRLLQLSDWLVEINFGIKGGNPLPPRVQLEMLVAKLAKKRTE